MQLFFGLTHSSSLLHWAGAQPQAVSSRQPGSARWCRS